MTKLMVLMLIFSDMAHGGPAVQRFSSVAACEASRGTVEKGFQKINSLLSGTTRTICVEVPE